MTKPEKPRFSLNALTGDGAIQTLRSCDAEDIKRLVVAVLQAGAALTLGGTRDGSSISLAIIDKGQVTKAYAADLAELEALIETIELQAQTL